MVWVSSDRVYHSGTEYRVLDKAEWEASPYANVHKYNHDISPARAALGSGGCTDCHASEVGVLQPAPSCCTAFSPEDGGPRWTPNYAVLGYSPWSVRLGAFREATLKPWTLHAAGLAGGSACVAGVAWTWPCATVVVTPGALAMLSWLALAGLVFGGIVVARSTELAEYMTVRRFTLDAAHFWIGVGILLLAVVLALQRPAKTATQCTPPALARILWVLIVFTGLCGGLVLLQIGWLETLTRLAYTGFDVGSIPVDPGAAVDLIRRLAGMPCYVRSEA